MRQDEEVRLGPPQLPADLHVYGRGSVTGRESWSGQILYEFPDGKNQPAQLTLVDTYQHFPSAPFLLYVERAKYSGPQVYFHLDAVQVRRLRHALMPRWERYVAWALPLLVLLESVLLVLKIAGRY